MRHGKEAQLDFEAVDFEAPGAVTAACAAPPHLLGILHISATHIRQVGGCRQVVNHSVQQGLRGRGQDRRQRGGRRARRKWGGRGCGGRVRKEGRLKAG